MNMIKILGVVSSVLGAGLTLLNAFVDDKKMDEKIEKALDKREKKKETEEA